MLHNPFSTIYFYWLSFFHNSVLKARVHRIVFDSDSHLGRLFDIVLISFIVLSVLIVILESGSWLPYWMQPFLSLLEWLFTIFFTIEYLMRLYCASKPSKYVFSFFGIIDFLATFPSYLAIFFPALHGLVVMRMFRLMRIFRIFKLFDYMNEGHLLMLSFKESFHKIVIFLVFSVVLVVSIGTIMYMVENGENGQNFSTIPNSIYWATVTMTTVGYGDIAPVTSLGRFLAAIVMLIGYTVLAVPTSIFTVSMVNLNKSLKSENCPRCGRQIDKDSKFCKYCGYKLPEEKMAES